MALPPSDEEPSDEATADRPTVRLIEASEARERRCAGCGRITAAWKPVLRQGTSVLLCPECAAKPAPDEGGCPRCGAPLGAHDGFCGRCGTKIEYECPHCAATLEADDTFCGRCGAQVA